MRMFRLCHFSKDISFSKINRLRGLQMFVQTLSFFKIYIISFLNMLQRLRGLRMFSLGHFSKDVSFSKINRLQGLRG